MDTENRQETRTIILEDSIVTWIKGFAQNRDIPIVSIVARAINSAPSLLMKQKSITQEMLKNLSNPRFTTALLADKVSFWAFVIFLVLLPYCLIVDPPKGFYLSAFFLGCFLGYKVDRVYIRLFVPKRDRPRMTREKAATESMKIYDPVTRMVSIEKVTDTSGFVRDAVVLKGLLMEGLERVSAETCMSPEEIVDTSLKEYIERMSDKGDGVLKSVLWLGFWLFLMVSSAVFLSVMVAIIKSGT